MHDEHTTSTRETQLLNNRLFTLAQRATTHYPESAAIIRKALALAQAERVSPVNRKLAFVESQTHPGHWYRVQGKQCSCQARVEYCAHAFAVALTRKAQADTSFPFCPATDRHYAELLTDEGPVVGYADYSDKGWQFFPAGDPERGVYVDVLRLTMLGHEELSVTQRAADRNLVDAVLRRFDYGDGK